MTTSTIQVTGTDFICVPVTDIDAAVEFYGTTLGLPQSKRWGRQVPGAEFETGNLTPLPRSRSTASGSAFHVNENPIALHVEDIQARRAELGDTRRIEFAADTLDTGVCHMAFFADPDGNALMLHHRYAPPDAQPNN